MLEDAPQPDDYIRILPEHGGQCVTEGKLLKGAPEWVGEMCATSAAHDLHEKRDLYEQAGVKACVAFVVATHEVRWHRLGPSGYEVIPPEPDGIYRSAVLPGLSVDGEAILTGDMPRVLAVLHQGLASPEHAAFVAALAARRQTP